MGQTQPVLSVDHESKVVLDRHFHNILIGILLPHGEDFSINAAAATTNKFPPPPHHYYNEQNLSIIERELPEELIFHILNYLPNGEICKLTRVGKNFNYWARHSQVWSKRNVEYLLDEPYRMWFHPMKEMKLSAIQTLNYFHSHFAPTLSNCFVQHSDTNIKPATTTRTIKVIVQGSHKCGKSKLLKQLTQPNAKFTELYEPTIATEIESKKFSFLDTVYNLQFWECSGNDLYKSVVASHWRSAKVFFYCFDLSSVESFEKLYTYLDTFKTSVSVGKPILQYLIEKQMSMFIIGMKHDLKRQVSIIMIEKLLNEIIPNYSKLSTVGFSLEEMRIQYFESSAKYDSTKQVHFPFLYALLLQQRDADRSFTIFNSF